MAETIFDLLVKAKENLVDHDFSGFARAEGREALDLAVTLLKQGYPLDADANNPEVKTSENTEKSPDSPKKRGRPAKV